MHAINSSLESIINQSEGRYLQSNGLQPIKRYLQTFAARSKTYEILRNHSDKLVVQALKKFANLHPEIIQKHGKRCQYDMTEALRYMALALLRDDPQFLKESLVLWQANILAAYQRNAACVVAYRCLQETLAAHLPPVANQLIDPYLQIMLQALDLPPKLMANVQKGVAV